MVFGGLRQTALARRLTTAYFTPLLSESVEKNASAERKTGFF
jgi:hypothetical protein